MNKADQKAEDHYGTRYRLQLLFYIGLLSAATYIIILFMGSAMVENLDRLNREHIYVSVSSWDIPVFVSLPCFFALIVALLLRLFNLATEKRLNACVKVALFFAVLAIVVRLPYGFVVSHYMAQQGYSSCWHYSSPSMMSPTVWVKKPGYCIENTGKIRKEILAWMDSLPNSGNNISVHVVRERASDLLNTWQREENAKYPDLNR